MNCKTCRRLLMRNPDLAAPPLEAEAHLAACEGCRKVAARLHIIEANVPRLPVPPSNRKADVLRLFQGASPAAKEEKVTPRKSDKSTQRSGPVSVPRLLPFAKRPAADKRTADKPAAASRQATLRRWAAVVAAAAVLIAVGVWLGNRAARALRSTDEVARHEGKEKASPSKTPDVKEKETPAKAPEKALAVAVLEHDLDLAETSDGARRVEVLGKLASTLSDETAFLVKAEAPKELTRLVRLHEKVVKDGLLPRARALPMGERRKTLEPIAARLLESHEALKALAARTGGAVGGPVESLAASSALAARTLRELMDEASE
ncbi:MAG: hypothetical protein U0793_08400 [Gemmataceae bacterium]